MKREHQLMLAAASLLLSLNLNAGAAPFTNVFVLGSTTHPVPYPTASSSLNCLFPENSGGYVAVWDDTNNLALIEHRDSAGNQTWQRAFGVITNGENTRVVLASATRTLWCTAKEWVLLDNTDGSTVSSDVWDIPELDPNKIVVQSSNIYSVPLLYVINRDAASPGDSVAYVFDPDMDYLGTVMATPPSGFWRGYETAWLIDHQDRTNQSIRAGTMAPGLRILNPLVEIPIAGAPTGGYTDQRVLTADDTSMFVLSSINQMNGATHFFSLFDRDGNVAFQNQMPANVAFTGSAVLSDGVLLSAVTLGSASPDFYLVKVDLKGVPLYQVHIGSGANQRYLALNCDPPRVLHVVNDSQLEICDVVPGTWGANHKELDDTGVILNVTNPSAVAPIGSTNYVWLTSTRPNNTPKP